MITYRSIQRDDYDAVQRFLADNGWAARVNDINRFHAMIERADRTVVALNDGKVVGFARALCDGVSNGYISMVAVAENFRRRGIGRRLVEHLMQRDDPDEITWVLRAGHASQEFWKQLGFVVSDIAMERVRRN
jgi:ribosomal protein S18 acetylase RimI-like enzyme